MLAAKTLFACDAYHLLSARFTASGEEEFYVSSIRRTFPFSSTRFRLLRPITIG